MKKLNIKQLEFVNIYRLRNILWLGVVIFNFIIVGNLTFAQQEKGGTLMQKAIFAGGCFWCMESDFEKLDGVIEVVSGYIGGVKENPTYQDYAQKGYKEAVEITYDSEKITYAQLLDYLWRHIDPTDSGGQFLDRGPQYSSAIFYNSVEEKKIAEESKERLAKSGIFTKPIVTEIIPAGRFYPAEDYHQDYYRTHPLRYKLYRFYSGRNQFLKKTWQEDKIKKKQVAVKQKKYKRPSDRELKKLLTPLQYKVTQQNGTERPFANEYWDNKKEGIYVDIVSGEPLFSSWDKYDSKTGWPSFTKPLEPANIIERKDNSLFVKRIELRSKHADSHLGHLFNDGPPTTGLRYCINSAALRFVPKQDLEKEGYAQYLKLFPDNIDR